MTLEPCSDLRPTAREITFTRPCFVAEFGSEQGAGLFAAAEQAFVRLNMTVTEFRAWRGDSHGRDVVLVAGRASDGNVYDWADTVGARHVR